MSSLTSIPTHAYGPLGYDHLITNVVPRLRQGGLTEADIDLLIVDKPARLFAFDGPPITRQ